MHFYVAAPWEEKERVKEVQSKIREHGHSIQADWTDHDNWKDTERDNEKMASNQVEKDIKAASKCDVFILLSNEKSRGSHAELGGALITNFREETEGPEIYIVGEESENHLFYLHPTTETRQTIEQVLQDIEDTK